MVARFDGDVIVDNNSGDAPPVDVGDLRLKVEVDDDVFGWRNDAGDREEIVGDDDKALGGPCGCCCR